MTITQPDLFGEVDAAHQARLRDALTCLIESVPDALNLVLGVRRLDRGEIKVGKGGRWAYSSRRPGLWFEGVGTWGGWYSRPRDLLTWDELDDLVAADPRVEQVREWSESLTAIDAWKDRYRPFELWPNAERWHPSWIAGDHSRPGWDERINAWAAVLDVLRDARSQVGAA